jgi:small subunit ribosomal protein S15
MKKDQKTQIIKDFQRSKGDTGSSEVQIALLSARITELTAHLQEHKHDEATRYGLIKMVGHRRSLLTYLKSKDLTSYLEITDKLKIRRK